MNQQYPNQIVPIRHRFKFCFAVSSGILLLLLFNLPVIHAQSMNGQEKFTLHGTVLDSSSVQPLVGASVLIKDSKQGTFTNNRGQFSIEAAIGQTLIVSYVSHATREIPVNSENPVTILLSSIQDSLNAVVVVGFGTQKKNDLTSAISTVNIQRDLEGKPFTDIGKGLQGAVPGLQITYSNGALTTAPSVFIRGGVSINGGSPLIIVDGIAVSDLGVVNPNDIASISVLKDAASTSIYGSGAAAGVILITTKSGTKNTRFSVNYSGNLSWSTPTVMPQFANPLVEIPMEDGAMQRNPTGGGIWGQFGFGGSEAGIDTLLNGIKNWQQNYAGKENGNNMILGQDYSMVSIGGGAAFPYFYRVWDPTSIMFQTMPAMNHSLNLSGGTDKLTYYVSGTYSGQEGILKPNPDKLHNYQVMASVTANATSWLTLSAKISDRQHNYYSPFMTLNGGNGDPYYTMYRWGTWQPYGTSIDPTSGGSYYWRSPLGQLENAGNNQALYNTANSLVTADIKFTPWLTLHQDFSYIYESEYAQSYAGLKAPIYDWWVLGGQFKTTPIYNNGLTSGLDFYNTSNMGDFYGDLFSTQITSNTYMTYQQKFGLHDVKVTAGLNAENGRTRNSNFGGYGLIDITQPQIPLLLNMDGSARHAVTNFLYSAAGPVPNYTKYPYIAGGDSWYSSAGYFARVNYNYADKYLLELVARYDGSSNYPAGDKWAFFPAASAGWNITKESFAQGIRNVVNNWKLRVSDGFLGDPIAAFYQPLMASGTNTWLSNNGSRSQYVGMPQNVPSSLTWEKVNKFDIGTDLTFLKGDLTATADWFQNTTTGMITAGIPIPQTFGTGAARGNNGTMRTRGFEVSVDYHHQFSNGLSIYGDANLFNFISKITKFAGNSTNSLASGFYVGQTVGEIWGFKTEGYFKDAADVASSATQKLLQSGNFVFGPGDIKYADLDGNDTVNAGKLTLANHGDLMKIGNSAPRYQYSFRFGGSWKGFDLDAYFQGVGSRQLWATGGIAIPNYGGNGELLGNQMDISTANTGTNQDVLNPTKVNQNAWWPNPYYGNGTSQLSGETIWANSAGASGNNFYPQTKYLLNLAYLRLKILTVGYTLPFKYTKKAAIQKVRLYVQGMNILTVKHDNHVPIDPEVTSGNAVVGAYYGEVAPINKTYALGVQVTF